MLRPYNIVILQRAHLRAAVLAVPLRRQIHRPAFPALERLLDRRVLVDRREMRGVLEVVRLVLPTARAARRRGVLVVFRHRLEERQLVDWCLAPLGGFERRRWRQREFPCHPPGGGRRFGLHELIQLLEPRDVALDVHQLVTDGPEIRQRVLVHLPPLCLIVFAYFVSQLGLRKPLGNRLLLFLQLEQGFLTLRDQLARGIGVGTQFFGDGLESRLVVGLHPSADVLRRRVGGRGNAREPRLVLATFF